MEDLEYITKDALIMCDKGGAPDFFKPTLNQTVKIHGCLVATQIDFMPLINIPSFKICTITQKPCMPFTTPWQETWPVKVWHQRTLLGRCYSQCALGGRVEFMTSGQIPLPDDAMAEVRELQEQCNKQLADAGYGDSVGECGFWEGLIPVWGSGKDMINDFQTGDYFWGVYNGVFCIWDVCSVIAGVASFGAGTAIMQGVKAGITQGVKKGIRALSTKAMAHIGRKGFQKLTKEALEESMCKLISKISFNVVKVCFTGDTLIYIKDGLKQIKDIKIGEEVFSFDKEKRITTIQRVTNFFEEEVNEILEIGTEKGVICTTRSHPFFVNGEFKDAEQINIGEYLLSFDEKFVEVLSLNFISKNSKVYNFEVENDHCYFVGEDKVLVLNKCFHTVFFKAFPHLRGKVVVHHAVEQQVWKKWPGLFDDAYKHSLDNLRGIPKSLNNELHLSKIRKEWDEFYRTFEKIKPSKDDVLEYVKYIDKKYGHLFDPPI